MKFLIAVCSSFLVVGSVWAEGVSPTHTWDHVSVTNQANWRGRLVITSANEPAYFTNKRGVNKGQTYDFTLNRKTSPFIYGFGFKTGANFNVSYTLTLYQSTSSSQPLVGRNFFSSKACQFNVSAKSHVHPGIRVEKYNGAKCSFKIVQARGENFSVG